MRLDDDGRPFDFMLRYKLVARINQRALPFAAREEARAACRRGQLRPRGLARLFPESRAAADRFDRDRLDHERFAAINKAELRLVRALEGALHFLQGR